MIDNKAKGRGGELAKMLAKLRQQQAGGEQNRAARPVVTRSQGEAARQGYRSDGMAGNQRAQQVQQRLQQLPPEALQQLPQFAQNVQQNPAILEELMRQYRNSQVIPGRVY